MSTRDNEINRDIDTAEGHLFIAVEGVEGVADDGVHATARDLDALDDVAEGHRAFLVGDAEDAGLQAP